MSLSKWLPCDFEQCHPLLWGGGILVDHWSTISSWISCQYCWPLPIDYLIRFWSIFVITLTLNFQGQIRNLLYLSQKWSDCHKTKSKHINWTLGLKCDHHLWPWPYDLDLEFSRSNTEFAISQPKFVWLPRNKKQTYRLNSRPQMWPSPLILAMTLTLIFQGQIWNLLYLSPKWSDCHERKCKRINWTLGLKCDHQILPWPWAWPWIFKIKYGICYISTKKRSDYHETKCKHIEWNPGLKCDQWVWPWQWPWSLNFQGQMWPIPSTIRMVLTKDFHLVTKVRWKDLPHLAWGDFRCRVPSTHLVYFIWFYLRDWYITVKRYVTCYSLIYIQLLKLSN